jgi:large subunit ribosomal protein L7Ae
LKKEQKNFGIGQSAQPNRDLYRYVKWPKYVRLQRQKRIIYSRLKVPPAVNQFSRALDKNTAFEAFKLMDKYRPESKQEKAERLKQKAANNENEAAAPRKCVKYGIKHVTALIENKKAALVLIAHDVDPLELVIWLPALCRKMGIPYAIIKGKARLGQVVGKKTATCVAFVKNGVDKADMHTFSKLVETVNDVYLNRLDETMRKWGGKRMGLKHRVKQAQIQKKQNAVLAARGLQ